MFSPDDRKEISYGWENLSLHPFRFGCYEGELRPGLSGWRKEKAEVLELLAFWKPEQQAAHRFRIWRPLASSNALHDQSSCKIKILSFFKFISLSCLNSGIKSIAIY